MSQYNPEDDPDDYPVDEHPAYDDSHPQDDAVPVVTDAEVEADDE